MTRERINLSMTGLDAVMAIAEGNPGALTVCMKILQTAPRIDPASALGALGPILSLDTHGIYASDVWRLYKDICRENIVDMIGLLRAVQLGHLPIAILKRAIDGNTGAVDVAAELAFVRECLPDFQKPEQPSA